MPNKHLVVAQWLMAIRAVFRNVSDLTLSINLVMYGPYRRYNPNFKINTFRQFLKNHNLSPTKLSDMLVCFYDYAQKPSVISLPYFFYIINETRPICSYETTHQVDLYLRSLSLWDAAHNCLRAYNKLV